MNAVFDLNIYESLMGLSLLKEHIMSDVQVLRRSFSGNNRPHNGLINTQRGVCYEYETLLPLFGYSDHADAFIREASASAPA